MILPSPPHALQSWVTCCWKGPILSIRVSLPLPSQVGQTLTPSGVWEPLPSQLSQRFNTSISISSSSPVKASWKLITWRIRRSAPREDRCLEPPPNRDEKIESKPPPNKSSMLILTPWNPPAPHGDPPGRSWPNMSYFLLSSGLERIAYASCTSLKRASASGSSGFLSG